MDEDVRVGVGIVVDQVAGEAAIGHELAILGDRGDVAMVVRLTGLGVHTDSIQAARLHPGGNGILEVNFSEYCNGSKRVGKSI